MSRFTIELLLIRFVWIQGRIIDRPPAEKNPAGKVARRPAAGAKGALATTDGKRRAAPGTLNSYDQDPGIKMCVPD